MLELASTTLYISLIRSLTLSVNGINLKCLLEFVKYQNETSNLETIAILRPESVDTHDFERILQQQMVLPLIIFNGAGNLHLARYVGFNTLALILLPDISYFPKNISNFGLRGRHRIPMAFSVEIVPSALQMQIFFAWCWELNILNMILIYKSNEMTDEVLTYTPFPTLQVINLTGQHYSTFIWDKVVNVQGYRFKENMFNDPPMLIQTSQSDIIGVGGLLFREYVRRLNGTYLAHRVPAVKETQDTREKRVILAPSRNEMDIGINTFISIVEFANLTATSYPIGLTSVCIIVPYRREAPKRCYIEQVFEPTTWLILCASLWAFFCLQIFLNYTLTPNHRFEYGLALVYALNSMLGQPLMMRASRWTSYRFILLCCVNFGFLISNTFLASLSSRFSTSIPGIQVETVQDFLDSKQQIMLHAYDRFIYFESGLLPGELKSRLYTTDVANMVQHRFQLNLSYAYAVTREKWEQLNYRQLRMWKPRFKIASKHLCSPAVAESWALQFDSPFDESLKQFIMDVHAYGFMIKFRILTDIGFRAKTFFTDNDEHAIPLTIEHLALPLYIYQMCCAICFIVFLAEHFAWRINHYFCCRQNMNRY